MSISPFIRPIQVQGGTFYTMCSARSDLGFTFNNDGKQFKFSKYALLNVPDIKRPTQGPLQYENYVQLDAIPGAFIYVENSKTYNMMLAESFQNYTLNLETMLTSSSTYDPDQLQSVSERVFFKWLKEIGALRFREASTSESPLTAGLRMTEENSSAIYSRVVQYIGEIDVVNSVKSQANSFSELYIHVPTKDGSTPLILFKSTSDLNYYPDQNLINSPADPLNSGFLYGRNFNQTNPASLDVHAFFDSKISSLGSTASEYELEKYDTVTSQFNSGWWFTYPESNSYWTQPPALSGTYDDPTNDSFRITGVKNNAGATSSIAFQRSRFDGISLDFDINNYYPIASNPSIHSFSDFNSLSDTVSFDFNIVLVYYDVIDVSTGNTATNLFGVLFLDDVEDTVSNGGLIPRMKKFKPNRISGLNGNSFGFKINLKFDTSSNDAAIVTAVNEYAPYSMQVFVDAINQLGAAADTLTTESAIIDNVSKEVESLKEQIFNNVDFETVDQRLTALEEQIENSQAALENSNTLIDLINRNYDEIINIYKNKTSVVMAYNTDVLQQGDGIFFDKSTPNSFIISNIEQTYTLDISPLYNVQTDFTSSPSAWTNIVKLVRFGNYMKLSNGSAVILDRDINIYIDDSQLRWSAGQSYKIAIDHQFPIDMYTLGSFDLVVFTDSLDRLNTGQTYSCEIARISSADFYAKGGKPSIEIICIDKNLYTFTFDLI